jgi:hypothetical protein
MEKEKILELMTKYEQLSQNYIKKLSKVATNQGLLVITSHVATSILAHCMFMIYKTGGNLDDYLKMIQTSMNTKTIILIEEDPTENMEDSSHTKH